MNLNCNYFLYLLAFFSLQIIKLLGNLNLFTITIRLIDSFYTLTEKLSSSNLTENYCKFMNFYSLNSVNFILFNQTSY